MGWRRWLLGSLLVLAACGGQGGPDRVESLAAAFASDDGGDLDEAGSDCVARAVVDLVGSDRLDELDDDGSQAVEDAELSDLGLDADDADDVEDVAEAFDGCDVDLDEVEADDLRGLGGDLVALALVDTYTDAVEDLLEDDDDLDGADDDQRRCIAAAIVATGGVEAFAEVGSPEDVGDAEDLADVDVELDSEIDDIAEDASDCDVDLVPVAEPVLEEFGFFGDADTECLVDELGEELVARLAVAALVLGDSAALTDPEPFDDLIFELEDAFFACEPEFEDDFDIPDFDDDEYAASLESAFLEDPVPAEPAHATCLAATWVRDLGPGFFQEVLFVEPDDLLVLDDLAGLGFIDEDAELLVEAAEACQVNVTGLALALLDTAPLAPEQLTCFIDLLADPSVAGDIVEGHLVGDVDGDADEALQAALAGCGIAG